MGAHLKVSIADAYALRAGETTESRDDRILNGLRGGDARALEAAFFIYYDGLYALAFRYTRSGAIAEELIQDVLLRMWSRRDRLVGAERLQALMFAAVRNAAVSWLRRERLEIEVVGRGEPGTAMSQFASEAADGGEARDVVRELEEAIDTLPERARLAITLRWQRQLRNTEIAEVMGITVKAVEFSIARALNHLRRILGPER